jgi:predicted transcriptional regulator
MEADVNDFVFSDLYFESMPRPTKAEEHGLDLNLIERGQHEPIKVNRKMVILDGYTRWQLLGDRGVKIKYEFRNFETHEEELNYVVECNVMKRNITPFQRVEAMLKLFGYQRYKKEDSDNFKRTYLDILDAIEAGNINSKNIVKYIGKDLSNTRMNLKKLTNQYYIRKWVEDLKTGGNEFRYEIMPKGKELLANRPMTKTMKEIGKDIGLDRNTVGIALRVIDVLRDNPNEHLLTMLRNGTITIKSAHARLEGVVVKRYKRVNPETKLKCPFCEHEAMKKEYRIVQ